MSALRDCTRAKPEHLLGVRLWLLAALLLVSAACSGEGAARVSPHLDVEFAVAVLTQLDSGAVGGTNRWAQSSVTYSLDAISHYPADYLAQVRAAFSFAATATGLEVREVHGSADVTVTAKSGNGAHTTADVSGGRIQSVTLQLGCCRSRPVWEDVLQSFGPMGDHADSRSVFSQDHTLQQASEFDAWVLHVLYALPPGSSPEAVKREAERRAVQSGQ